MFVIIGATAQCCASYGQGSGLIVLDDLACAGTETSLFDCSHRGINSHNCGHGEDVGVTCVGKLQLVEHLVKTIANSCLGMMQNVLGSIFAY